MRRWLCVGVIGLVSACFGSRELEDSSTVTFEVENATAAPLVFTSESWLEIEREGLSLRPGSPIGQLCDHEDPVRAFDRLGLPPPGALLEPGGRLSFAWRTNAFTGWRCDPGWSDCSECVTAEPVPLGRARMRICVYRGDVRCRDPEYSDGLQPSPNTLQPDCTRLDVAIGDEDRTVEVVIDQLAPARCSGDDVLEPL